MQEFAASQDKSLVRKVAYQILSHFDKSYRWFTRITRGAQERFEKGNWKETQLASKERITIYEQSLSDAVAEIYQLTQVHQKDDVFWQELKKVFALQLEGHPQFELAETFYNSVIGRLFKHRKIDNDMMFVLPSRCFLPGQDRDKVINSFDTTTTVREMYESIFKIYRYNIPFENFERDLQNLENALRARLNKEQLASVQAVEILKPTFFRGKAAYLIGRICMPDETLPFVIAMRRYNEPHMFVDALLTDRKDLSVIFGFARSYFMADTQNPAEVAAFLQELLPNKKHFELYMAMGHYKHGKTVFYRNFLQHMDESDDKFEAAPGIRGLVVKECYKLVKMSDRVGRMADTHEYVNFRFPLDRIEPDLIDELKETCASSLEFTESEIIIKHMYIERKMTPLNLYLQEETDEEKITRALDELGLCIKQIAMANIFPGDMLHKNFGITRHGRVIFYDYDEICLMNERNFRALPKSDDPYAIDTLSVAPNDVFPEQFEHFIVGKRKFKDILKSLHGDLMTPEYWHEVQEKCARGDVQHFTPYNANMRFDRGEPSQNA